jgi:hypothetical protein
MEFIEQDGQDFKDKKSLVMIRTRSRENQEPDSTDQEGKHAC